MDSRMIHASVAITCSLFVAGVCRTEAIAAQGSHAPAYRRAVTQGKRDVADVKGTKMSSVLPSIERALQGMQGRAAGDRVLKPFATEPIVPVDYGDYQGKPRGYRRALSSPTDEQIIVDPDFETTR